MSISQQNFELWTLLGLFEIEIKENLSFSVEFQAVITSEALFEKQKKVSILGGIYQIFPLSAEYRHIFFHTFADEKHYHYAYWKRKRTTTPASNC